MICVFMASLLMNIVLFLLSIYTTGSRASSTNSSDNFFELCPPTRCSNTGPTIRFPFRLNTQPPSCGIEGYELSCSGSNTVFRLPSSGDYYVKQISYLRNWISLKEIHTTNCPIQSVMLFNRSGSILTASYYLAVVKCTERVAKDGISGPIDCLRDDNTNFIYVMNGGDQMDKLPLHCKMFKSVGFGNVDVNEAPVERLLRTGEIVENWNGFGRCYKCENSGKYCGLNSTSTGTICSSKKPPSTPVIIGTTVGGTIFLALVIVVLAIYRRRKSESELKIEKFLANYKTLNPTRYTFTDIKKITSRFKKRLGQGGFGSVYQGKLPNGIPVAVKMLEKSEGNGEEFINEVATISRIHHFNVVHLLGFCYEGTRRALVYEFMPNGSLDKFILSKEAKKSRDHPLSWEKLQEIAIGIAHGIEYLHQGCNLRILHFDIKPHNILLDGNFQPKISDFGLAKLCSKDQSVVSMTAARGTTGYIAPELFSRNFGEVSYKSDVYSFGMLLLEMVGCRKNIDVTVENQSQIYFPEWIYERMRQGKELGLRVEMDGDEEIAKKLANVGLWCIQWSPSDRPSMKRVVQMLEGDFRSVEMPHKPFL
ncbi:rust resistance kinase Lr10-like [Camellia sinensis]|uniref:rust resistance kinase Lr10-like n=1 Tax=Camellia sinensis TaxID=4442 RepID=UPI001035AD87|nr:rust resistance kinase Lr10-like [Camellia sinensis]